MPFQLYVKWRFITSPDVEEASGGRVPEGSPDEVGEDEYHPDKLIAVGPSFDEAQGAADYAIAKGWKAEDVDIRPYQVR